jgi:hypothetical protein
MAAKNFTSVAKPLVYDLLSRLNSSFSRVSRNLSSLEQTRVFNPATMKTLSRLSKELQADANHHLLETLQEIETRDRARFGKVRPGKARAPRPKH